MPQTLIAVIIDVCPKCDKTASIRIVADCVAFSCQVTIKLKLATSLEFTIVSAIIFMHC